MTDSENIAQLSITSNVEKCDDCDTIDVVEKFEQLAIVTEECGYDSSCTTPIPKLENAVPKPETTFRWIDGYRQDIDGDTTLHMTIIHEMIEEAMLLIDHVPHPSFLNIRNNLLQTPVHIAVLTNQPNILRKLIDSGATLDIRDWKGNTALHVACQMGNLPCTKELFANYPVGDFLITSEDYDRIPNPDLQNYEGQYCVHLATRGKYLPILQILNQCRADINAREGKGGRAALHYAVDQNYIELVTFLVIECKADVNAQTFGGLTPFQLARDESMANHLLMLGAYKIESPPSDFDSDSSSHEMTVAVNA